MKMWALQNKTTAEYFLQHSGHPNAFPATYPSRASAREVASVLCNEYKPVRVQITLKRAA